ncbi:MAG: caspase family protein [Fimbriimonadaceae bacterium]|nr:caspase family protein [Fimbriimonadaceae bacterium]QYK55617.1 MAG: caspase family protein [Fimbriimonadaceae bacterium]
MTAGLLVGASALAHGQAWNDAYQRALAAARSQNWMAARDAFQEAIAIRPEDQAGPTVLPGSVTEPVRWRDGSPYSPNFGFAYANYKLAMAASGDDRNDFLNVAATTFETLLAKGQASSATYYFLNRVYGEQGRPDKQRNLEEALKQTGAAWRVDTEFVAPEEKASVVSATPAEIKPNEPIKAGATTTPGGILTPKVAAESTALVGRVPIVPTKFALIIGNGQGNIEGAGLSFASSDAMFLRDAIVQNAGYDEKNVELIVDATADQMRIAAAALAERMPADAKLMVFFTGVGVNIDGRDYLAGIDATMTTDTSHMLSKQEMYGMFLSKGAQVFAFFQTNRPVVGGRYFGQEYPLVGAISQAHATSPDAQCFATQSEGRLIGVYTKAFVDVVGTLRSNNIIIGEFGWQVFNAVRGGLPGQRDGGGSVQVPSLPVVRYMSPSAGF